MLPFPPFPKGQEKPPVQLEDFAGSLACAGCHATEYQLWKNSTHGQAGGLPGEVKIIARFDGQPLRFKDAVVTPLITSQGEYRFVIEAQGQPVMEIPVKATVGGGHLYGGGTQTFFTEFPDGTLRFLPFDFIRDENLWFVQLRKDNTWAPISEEISLKTDLANWPPHRVLGALPEFSNCQNCHGSQVIAQYNEKERRYETRFTTLQINCESCHGPGKRHIELMSSPAPETLEDIGMEPLVTLSKDQSLMVCFQCHATKDALREDYLPGQPLEDFFSIKLPMLAQSPFLTDGRVRSFDYQSNHLYSDCYLNGSMTCVDCHDPHSQNYRDFFGNPLPGKFANGQCTGCHASKAESPELHSRHRPESPGNLCVNCHIPFLQHQGLGKTLKFARSDHTIPIPRPAFDAQLGIENACQKCHRNKTIEWLQEKVREWYGDIKPHHSFIRNLLKAGQIADPKSAGQLLLNPAANHPMAQMDGLVAYIKQFMRPQMPFVDLELLEKLKAYALLDDLDLKSLALTALHLSFDHDPEVRAFLVKQLSGLGGKAGAVRNRWGIAADYFGSRWAAKGDYKNAIVCFQKSLEVKPGDSITLANLASAHANSGDLAAAIFTLETAARLKPQKASLHFQLAQFYVQNQQPAKAIRALEEGLQYAPDNQNARQLLQQLYLQTSASKHP
jgi:hypothetical protein